MKPAPLLDRVTVVTVSYNSSEVLAGLLDSLEPALSQVGHYQVLVVDNMSSDSSVAIAQGHNITDRVIETGRNAGYAAAINAADAYVGDSEALLVLNPDIRLSPGSVRLMLDRMASDGTVGIVAPQLFNEDGILSLSLRKEPSILTAWSEALVGGTIACRMGLGEVIGDPRCYADAKEVDWATGAALLIAPWARQAVGQWDESYFLYSEEVDYMRRVRLAGYNIVYAPAAMAVHVGGQSNERPDLYALLTANRIRYYARHHRPLATAMFWAGVVTGEAIRAALGGRTHQAALRAALALPEAAKMVHSG
ncbi:glycosyltransferase family 2 protein [Pelagibacterium sp. H642]|uniref:glycosyltransferase family 2 protein n=1 Tax=Pelagibacterium sp. H642 TaxID=1881069 RepID=UPI002815AC63|nr:glycosyltransferase family 2 protein [Pelagibacterium sp. H642]WMT92828.1 glycosyltransferase family 2 protein [Pelagibacterium sp. H642]